MRIEVDRVSWGGQRANNTDEGSKVALMQAEPELKAQVLRALRRHSASTLGKDTFKFPSYL